MLPGIGGHLISELLLEQQLVEEQFAPRVREFCSASRKWRQACQALGPASGLRTLLEVGADPFVRLLGFPAPDTIEQQADWITASIAPLALVVTGWRDRLDPLWRPAVVEARRRGHGWCLLFNGTQARLISAARLCSRRYVEFDLELTCDDERTTAVMLLLLNRQPGSLARLETLVAASERHGSAVCRSLRDGVLEAAAGLLGALMRHRSHPPLEAAFEQSLTIVYRILFLLFAEARHLVPLWHPIYRDSYSLDALQESLDRAPAQPGIWEALRATSRLAHTGCRAGDLRVTPFNGRLFAPARTPLADRRDVDDEAARDAVVSLTTRPSADRGGRERIAYRDLGVEQLGAVYESLLDFSPTFDRTTRLATLRPGSGVRKETGTFYTPQALARYLVRQTLGPLVRDASPQRILELKVLDPAMGSGAFLVASCQYLAEAYARALIRSGECHAADLGPAEHASMRRTIAERCLFGVDLNPTAVQLARLSLWLATLAADRPLSFLDHRLQAGDSLLGAWLACLTHPPSTRGRKPRGESASLFDDNTIAHDLRAAMPVRFSLAIEPHDTPEQIKGKDRALTALNAPDGRLSQWKRVADLWCSHWFAPGPSADVGVFGALSDAMLTKRGALPDAIARNYLAASRQIAETRRFFHWELEFPEVFFDQHGQRLAIAGFDAVISNPPWDMIRADAGPAAGRSEARLSAARTVRFTRDSGTYTSQSNGHANRYQLFVERAIALTRSDGRIGLIVPSGLATDQGGAKLRRLLFERCNVDAVVGFDNRDAVFPIHRSVRFLLLTATAGAATKTIACRLGERDPALLDMHEGDDEFFPVHVTPDLIRRISGDELVLPDVRNPLDLRILERTASLFHPLGSARGWHAQFGRELNVTEDRSALGEDARGWPVFEGKHLAPFRVQSTAIRWRISASAASRLLGTRHLQPRLAYRDVASSTNRRTLIAAILPARSASTHTLLCLRTPLPLPAQHFLCGLFNSFLLNYLARLRVTTHVTASTVQQLPVPVLDPSHPSFREISAIARLQARAVDPVSAARLDAVVAQLYQLTADEFAHVLSTFPLVDRAERDATLQMFKNVEVRG
jgi:hypothetical protein